MARRTKGEGSIFESPKGSGIWHAQVTLGDGKQIRRKGPSQKEARAALKELIKQKDAQVDLGAKQPTLWEWWQVWLNAFSPTLKPHVYEDYLGIGRTHVRDHRIGKKRLIALTFADVQGWVNELAARGLKPSTVRNAYGCLCRALKVAERSRYIDRNVALGVSLPAMDDRNGRISSLDFAQARAFLDTVEGDRYEVLYLLAITLGCRQGELLGLTWDCVNLTKGTLTIRQTLQRIRPRGTPKAPLDWALLAPKTKASLRTITLSPDLLAALRAHKAAQAAERLKGGPAFRVRDPFAGRGGLVFTTDRGAPLHGKTLITRFRRALKRADVPPIRFHDLRHTAATLMLALGYQIVAVSKILGHASPNITMKVYAHALEENVSEAVAGLSERLRRG